MSNKSYSELILLPTFEDRLEYLKDEHGVGNFTFSGYRAINQRFYQSKTWRDLRHHIIARDYGCDLAIRDYPIYGKIVIHHICPLSIEDFEYQSNKITDPDNMICVSDETHRAIHYGSSVFQTVSYKERTLNDTCPWKNRRK